MAPTIFRSTTPSLAFYVGGRLVKFQGGKLEANEDQVEGVEAFAESHPHYGIERADEAGPEATETPQETAERETVDEVIDRVGDDKAAAQEALEAEYDADEPRVTLINALEAVIDKDGQ